MIRLYILVICFICSFVLNTFAKDESIYDKIDLFGEVLDKICKEYVEDVDQSKTIDAATLAHISKVVMENDIPINECTMVLNPTLYYSLFRIDDFIHISKTNTANVQNGLVGSVMGMNVVLSNNITSTNANAAVDSDDGALNDNNDLGGFVLHKDALAFGFSKQPTVNSEYDIDYIAHKLVGDYIGGAKLVQDASQTKCWGIVEEGTTAW